MDTTILLQRLEELAESKGISLTAAFINSGVGKNFKSNMKTSNPSIGKITMLANYFDVSVDYLLGKTDIKKDKPAAVSDEAWDAILKDDNKIKLVNLIMTLDREELLKASQIFDAVFPGLKDSESNSENSKPD